MSSMMRSKTQTISGMLTMLAEFSKMHDTIPIQTLEVFFFIAKQGKVTMPTIQDRLKMTTASAARNVQKLTKKDRLGKPGLDLIIEEPDPMDPRRKLVRLNAKGERLVHFIQSLFVDTEEV